MFTLLHLLEPWSKLCSSLLIIVDHISQRHLFWPWLPARLCRKWCRNGWTVGMAEMEKEALRWKVHLKGFGNNPLKLPQGIRWKWLHLGSPPCFFHCLRTHFFKSRYKKRCYLFQLDFQLRSIIVKYISTSDASPSYCCLVIALWFHARWRRRYWHRDAKIIDFAFLSFRCLANAGRLSSKSCCFSPSYFSCHFDFIMQDLCWVHNPLKWAKGL